ncbi:MAG: DUF4340 domain-containing protein [Cyanobacteriota bacterium]|nr:DUF4340 domain-containing protein [Cyanobacteriota bacterium]
MKFKKSTQILFASALVLAAGVAVYEGTIAPERQAAQLQQQQVFNFEIDRVVALTLETPDRTLQFERLPAEDEENITEPRWEFQVVEAADESEIQKTPVLAKNAYILFLLDALTNAKSDRILSVAPNELGEYGLDEPQAKIDVKFEDEATAQIQLGKRDFSESFIYAIADSQTESPTESTAESPTDLSVLLISTNIENGVNRSLSEWQADEEATQTPPATEAKPADATSEGEANPESEPSPPSPDTEATETPPTNVEDGEATENLAEPQESEPPEASSETENQPESIPNPEDPNAEEPTVPEAVETPSETPNEPPPVETTEPTPESETPETSEAETNGE